MRGEAPAFDTPDEDVYLEGRNLVLLSKTAVFAARTASTLIVIGPLAGNPFPDARPEFFEAMARALSLGLDTTIAIEAPFLALHKSDVIKVGMELGVPFELTLSCMQPVPGPPGRPALHCGRCSKCREGQDAFAAAGFTGPRDLLSAKFPKLPIVQASGFHDGRRPTAQRPNLVFDFVIGSCVVESSVWRSHSDVSAERPHA